MDNNENIFVIGFWQSIISIYVWQPWNPSYVDSTGRDHSSSVHTELDK